MVNDADIVEITVCDNATGNEFTITVPVDIKDDVPTIEASADSLEVTEGTSVNGSIIYSYGADVPNGSMVTVKGGTPVEGSSNQWRVEHGVVTLNDDGTFTFKADANLEDYETSQEIVFQITDADGDVAEDSVTVTLEQAKAPEYTAEVTVDEAALDGGNAYGGMGSKTAEVSLEGYTIIEGGKGQYGIIERNEDGSWQYTLNKPFTDTTEGQDDRNVVNGADSVDIKVRDDATGNEFTITVPVSIVDDIPTISADKPVSVKPGEPDNENLQHVDQEISFINYEQTGTDENGNPIYGDKLTDDVTTSYWNGQVTISAVKVSYKLDDKENIIIDDNHPIIEKCEDDENFQLQYSPYNGGGNQVLPGGGNQQALVSDWGLMVTSQNQLWNNQTSSQDKSYHDQELAVSPDGKTSAGLVIDLGDKLAYGFSIDFGAFYSGNEASTNTRWDNLSEKALLTFYRGDEIVYCEVVTSNSKTGGFTFSKEEVILGGFDKVVVSSVSNATEEHPTENSDFVIKGFDFVTKNNAPLFVSEGVVTADPGADGFAYDDGTTVKFDLENMVNGELTEDGAGTKTVWIDGEEETVTLELSEGSNGSILTGTIRAFSE